MVVLGDFNAATWTCMDYYDLICFWTLRNSDVNDSWILFCRGWIRTAGRGFPSAVLQERRSTIFTWPVAEDFSRTADFSAAPSLPELTTILSLLPRKYGSTLVGWHLRNRFDWMFAKILQEYKRMLAESLDQLNDPDDPD